MEQHMSAVALACLAVVLAVVVALFVRQPQITTRLRRRNAALQNATRIRDEELRHLVGARLPALVESLYGRPVEVPGPRNPQFAGSESERAFRAVMEMFADSMKRAKARADDAAKSTLKSTMRAVQSLANEQQLAISTMQERHDDPDVLEGLLRIDHMNAQLGRRAQATAVLCGSWPGQQRSASPIVDVVRGATSRIRDYLRVQVNGDMNVAVASRVVEPVVLAVAELLDNAARHSPPTTAVEVNFQSAHNGIAVVIDDAGVAMDAEELQRASRLLSGQESVDINRLGDPPQVGFAVVGVLAARYGFTVSVDTRSPYGGVRAVVFLPTELLTRVEKRQPAPAMAAASAATPAAGSPEPVTPSLPPGAPTPSSAVSSVAKAGAGQAGADKVGLEPYRTETGRTAAEPSRADAPAERQVTANGLPKRRRVTAAASRQTGRPSPMGERPSPADRAPVTGQAQDPGWPAPNDPPPSRSARDIAAGMGAWQRGTRSGRATVPPEGTDSEGERSDER